MDQFLIFLIFLAHHEKNLPFVHAKQKKAQLLKNVSKVSSWVNISNSYQNWPKWPNVAKSGEKWPKIEKIGTRVYRGTKSLHLRHMWFTIYSNISGRIKGKVKYKEIWNIGGINHQKNVGTPTKPNIKNQPWVHLLGSFVRLRPTQKTLLP